MKNKIIKLKDSILTFREHFDELQNKKKEKEILLEDILDDLKKKEKLLAKVVQPFSDFNSIMKSFVKEDLIKNSIIESSEEENEQEKNDEKENEGEIYFVKKKTNKLLKKVNL